jgi:hypothetical protein
LISRSVRRPAEVLAEERQHIFVNFLLQQLRGHPDLAADVDTLIRGALVSRV